VSVRQGRKLLRVARSLAVVYAVQGRLDSAIAVVRDAVRGGHRSHDNDVELSWSWCVLGTTHYCAGDFAAALDAFDAAEALTARHVTTQREWVGVWRGSLYRDENRFDLAEAELSVVGDKAVAELALLRMRQKDSSEALRLARVAHRVRHRNEAAIERGRAEGTLAIVCAHRGLYEAAEGHFLAAEATLEASGCLLRLLSLRLHRVGADLDRGRFESATLLLRQTLAIARQKGYRHFLWWDPFLIGKICAQAIVMRIEPAYVRELAMTRLGREEAVHFRPLLNSGTEPVRGEALAIIQGLAQEAAVDSGNLDDLMRDCDNPRTATALRRAVENGTLTSGGLERLRQRFGLTWKELEVFVMYYLAPAVLGHRSGTNLRQACAERLYVSENTVRAHIKSIRLKLDLRGEAGTVAVKEWLVASGITTD
jgi:tetratricopeptide (TPR) repeat protein